MGIMIDSSVFIDWEKGGHDYKSQIDKHTGEECYLSVIAVSELLHGVHRADSPKRRMRRSAFVEAILQSIPVVEIDVQTARIHSEVLAALKKKGALIGAHDLWIGCSAIAHGLALATCNMRDYGRIPGLSVEDWSLDSDKVVPTKPPKR